MNLIRRALTAFVVLAVASFGIPVVASSRSLPRCCKAHGCTMMKVATHGCALSRCDDHEPSQASTRHIHAIRCTNVPKPADEHVSPFDPSELTATLTLAAAPIEHPPRLFSF